MCFGDQKVEVFDSTVGIAAGKRSKVDGDVLSREVRCVKEEEEEEEDDVKSKERR